MSKLTKALVLVESPNKRGKISFILEKLFKEGHLKFQCVVLPTIGHTSDLPQKELGIDEETFALKVVPTKLDVLKKIKATALSLGGPIILATDPDREGEAIGYYVQEYLKAAGINGPFLRVDFHEITVTALKSAFTKPREVDLLRVKAQNARRALDRLCGYKISPLLWRTLGSYKLAAGRVQSYALNFLVANSLVRRAFEPKEQWFAVLHLSDGKHARSEPFDSKREAEKLGKRLEELVPKWERIEEEQNPFPPFTTSRLLQDAGKRWGYSSQAVMTACQDLFAAGRITYHRTDSTSLSWGSVGMMRKELSKKGKFVLSAKPRSYSGGKTGKHSQGAHEAIRPSHPDNWPHLSKTASGKKNARFADKELIYRLIFARALATQLEAALVEKQTLSFYLPKADKPSWVFHGRKLLKHGWYDIDFALLGEDDTPLNKKARPVSVTIESGLTEPPPPITEAGLIQKMEKDGVGRPSTYASVIASMLRHQYINRNGRVLLPTPSGEAVSIFLRETFPQLLDAKFTAVMEERLDMIEKGTQPYRKTLARYNRWINRLLLRQVKRRFTVDTPCPSCNLSMLILKFPWKGGVPYLQCFSCKTNHSVDFDADGVVQIFKNKPYPGTCVLCHKESLVRKQSNYGAYVECQNERCGAVQKGQATVTKKERLERAKVREAEEKRRAVREEKLAKEGKPSPRRYRRWS